MKQFAYISTKQGVAVYYNNEIFDLDRTWPQYDELLKLLAIGESKAEEIAQIARSMIAAVRSAIQRSGSQTLRVKDDTVFFKDQQLPDSAAERILRMANEGQNITYLETFFENLYQNPSFRVVESLYAFLEYGKIPITKDGHFLAYKAIRSDWTDIHSGKFNNSIGQTVEIPRNQVDEDPNRTCSKGLHVCSFDYLPNFAHADGHVVVVKVNPKDVVAIPDDYNNTKMRCSRYEVVSEVDNYYANRVNVLAESSVRDDWDQDPETEDGAEDDVSYEIEILDDTGWILVTDTHFDFQEAKDEAEELEKVYVRVRIVEFVNADRTAVLYATNENDYDLDAAA